MDYQLYKRLACKALGREKAELVLKNAQVLNVFTEEIINCDVAIDNGIIVGLGEYSGEAERDMTGKYLVPGFIDAHLHLETTLVLPSELIAAAVKWGTTTFITDPHEAANVAGEAGIDYMLDQTEDAEANVFVMIPSCVPSCQGEDNGCMLDAERMRRYLDNPRVLGLAEVMDYLAVTEADDEILKKLSLFDGKIRDGHAPFLSDKRLAAYAMAKIKTDHECSDYEYAMKQRRNGMHVLIREGSGAKNVEAIIKGIVDKGTSTEGFSFCTDDKHIEDIMRDGHISYNIRKSIELGIPAIKAYKMATLNAAQCYGLDSLGAIAPGYQADIVVLEDFDEVAINAVLFRGVEVIGGQKPTKLCPPHLKQTVRIAPITADMLKLAAKENGNEIIQLIGGQITTKLLHERVGSENGLFTADSVYNKAVVVERHKSSGRVGVAPVKGFGLTDGAIALTVSHDSHNIIAIGDNDEDILRAIAELDRIQGGYVIVQGGDIVETLPLPIMGLISDIGHENVVVILQRMIGFAHKMGVPQEMDPFITLSFIALPVIPEIRVTTRGIMVVS